jgi:hypothetical protein
MHTTICHTEQQDKAEGDRELSAGQFDTDKGQSEPLYVRLPLLRKFPTSPPLKPNLGVALDFAKLRFG